MKDNLAEMIRKAATPEEFAGVISYALHARDLEIEQLQIDYQLLLTASKQCSGSPKHGGGCGCLCHGDGND